MRAEDSNIRWQVGLLAWVVIGASAAAVGCGGRAGAAGGGARVQTKGDDAAVKGRVAFDTGWRKHLSSRFEQAPPAAFVASGPTWEDWERAALSGLTVTLSGGPTPARTAVRADGSFELGRLRPGNYRLQVSTSSRGSEIRALTTMPLPLERRARARAQLVLAGQDLADLDEDGDRREAVVRAAIDYRAPGIEYTRTMEPGGLVKTTYPEDTVEYGTPGETVRVFNADGTKEERTPARPGPARARPQLLEGEIRPLVDPGSQGGHGVLRISAKVDLEGQERPVSVLASFFSPEGSKRLAELADDGSGRDLEPSVPGHQGSGDAKAGDGVFTLLMPIDSRSYSMVYNGVVVLTALGESGGAGTSTALFLYGPPVSWKPALEGRLAEKLGEVELVARSGGLVATVVLKQPPVQPFSGAVFGPEGQEAPLIAEPGGQRYTSSVITGKLAGYVFVALAGPEGAYQAGAVMDGLEGKSKRLFR
ncbi:MAG: hypothetical protein HYY25_10190 [Candidatus Wallbacteria bacterium]|nr:hypothetical protein [Candidatus Wallbacteria bacterium]